MSSELPRDQQAALQRKGYISGADVTEGVPKPAEAPAKQVSPLKDFIAGGVGGIFCVLVGHPFDLTKVRLQTAAPGQYTGAIDVVRQTLAKQGPFGMFRGMASPLVGVTPMFAVSFWGYGQGKKLVYAINSKRSSPELSYGELAFAGAFSAVPQTVITTPIERVKVVLQTQGEKPIYKGPMDVVSKLYAEGGISSLYRGTVATLARDAPGSAAYFVTYEAAKKAFKPAEGEAGVGAVLGAGALAGIAMWSLVIPIDTIKSRLQSAPQGTYSGFLDCTRKIMAAGGGVKALFKGLSPAMARAAPANAATFLGYELALKVLHSISPPPALVQAP